MINNSVVVICLLGIALGESFRYDEPQHDRYNGPPAPLNPDGTVAFTPEYEHIRDEHSAFFDLEYNRIKDNVDAPVSHRTGYQTYPHDNQDLSDHQTHGTTADDDGLYDPELYEEKYSRQYDDGQYRPHLYEQEHSQYDSPQSTQGTSHHPSFAPATLKQIPENQGIAPSFLAYHQALSRHRRSAERYQGPPAPLNHDLTVDYTPEVKHVNAAHFTAVADQFKRLQATAALAAAHPDRTSPPSKDYNPQSNEQHSVFAPHPHHQEQHFGRKKRSYTGQYRAEQPNTRAYDDGQYRHHQDRHDDGQYKHHHHKFDDGQYRPHHHNHDHGQYKPHLHQVVNYRTEPFRPAPLNPDGTVTHVPEYHAIAASHLAAHHSALSAVSH